MRDVASGRSACLCIFWEEYWHMICAAFSTGRVGPEQLRARAGARCGENSCCSSLAKMQQRKSAALGYATACVASRMVWSACTSLEVGGASLRGRSTPGQMTDVAQHSSEMVSSACSQAAASLLDASACLHSL